MSDLKVILGNVDIDYPDEVRGQLPLNCKEHRVGTQSMEVRRTTASITGHPDDDLERGQVLLDLGEHQPSVTLDADDLFRALLPFVQED